MASIFRAFLDWLRGLFFKEEMELTLVGIQNSGKTTLVNVMAVSTLFYHDIYIYIYIIILIYSIVNSLANFMKI
jgi:hypothetical protein